MHLSFFPTLYHVTRFVNLMEGHIWIESEGLGKGCTAIFIVKLGIPEHSNDSNLSFIPKMLVHGQTNFPGLKVLVMDENGSVIWQFVYRLFHFRVYYQSVGFYSIILWD